jgi:hypothetical protein
MINPKRLAPFRKPQPPSRKPEHPPSLQAVGERGRDENLEKGAARQLQITTQCRVCFRKICQRDFLTCRSSRSMNANLQTPRQSKSIKNSSFTNQIAL